MPLPGFSGQWQLPRNCHGEAPWCCLRGTRGSPCCPDPSCISPGLLLVTPSPTSVQLCSGAKEQNGEGTPGQQPPGACPGAGSGLATEHGAARRAQQGRPSGREDEEPRRFTLQLGAAAALHAAATFVPQSQGGFLGSRAETLHGHRSRVGSKTAPKSAPMPRDPRKDPDLEHVAHA